MWTTTEVGSQRRITMPSTTRWKNGPYFGVSHAARGFPVLVHLKGLARVRLK